MNKVSGRHGHCNDREDLPQAFEEEEASHLLTGEIPGLGAVVRHGAIPDISPTFAMRIEKGEALMIR